MAEPISAPHFDAVDSASDSTSVFDLGSFPSSRSGSAASSVCSTPASANSSGRTLRSGRVSVAPVLPLSVSTRSMARSSSKTHLIASGSSHIKTVARSVKKKGSGKLAVLNENLDIESAFPTSETAIRPRPPAPTEKKPAARAPLAMTQSNLDNFLLARPVATGDKASGGKAMPMKGKRKAEGGIWRDAELETGTASKKARVESAAREDVRTGISHDVSVNAQPDVLPKPGQTSMLSPAAVSSPADIVLDVDEDEDEDEDDEPLPTRFASLRHRPPTPPRLRITEDTQAAVNVEPRGRSVVDENPGESVHGVALGCTAQASTAPTTPLRPRPASSYTDVDVRMTPEISTTPFATPPAKVATQPTRPVTTTTASFTFSSPAHQQASLGVSPRKTPGSFSRFGTPRKMAPLPRSKLGGALDQHLSPLSKPAAINGDAQPAVTAARAVHVAARVVPVQASEQQAQASTTSTASDTAFLPAPSLEEPVPELNKASAARPTQPIKRVVSGTAPKVTGLMGPPSLPTRALRSSTSTRALAGRSDTAAHRQSSLASTGSAVVPTQSTLPRSSTLYANTISSAAKTSIPPAVVPNVGFGAGMAAGKRAPLGEMRRPGGPFALGTSQDPKSAPVAPRKPSYPSSLSVGRGQTGLSATGSSSSTAIRAGPTGSIGRPRDRTLSGPVPASVLAAFRSEGPDIDTVDGGNPDDKAQKSPTRPVMGAGTPPKPSPDRVHSASSGRSDKLSMASPTRRVVSAPVRSSLLFSDDADARNNGDAEARLNPLSMSTSSATDRRESLGLSMSERRQGSGWNDTSKSFVGLAAALERLKRKDSMVGKGVRASLGVGSGMNALGHGPVDGASSGSEAGRAQGAEVGTEGAKVVSDRLAVVHRPRHSIAIGATQAVLPTASTSASSFSSTAVRASASGIPRTSTLMAALPVGSADADPLVRAKAAMAARCLKGVVAFVDVWTADGTDSSAIFQDMLRGMGARVLARPSDSVTHIIYKSGKPSTLTWYRKAAAQAAEAAEEADYKARLAQDEREMQLDQGTSGVGASAGSGGQEDSKSGPAVAEPKHVGPFIVGLSWVTKCKAEGKRVGEEKYLVDVKEEDVFGKRRKSMDPRALTLSDRLSTTPSGRPPLSAMSQVSEARRQSMLYAPKIGSPLKRAYR